MEEDKFSYTELLYLHMLIKQNLIDNQIDLIENDNSFKKMTTSFDRACAHKYRQTRREQDGWRG